MACAGFVIGSTRNPQIPTFYQRTIARDPSSQWDFHRDIPQVPHHCIYLRCPVLLGLLQLKRPGEGAGPEARNIRRTVCHDCPQNNLSG